MFPGGFLLPVVWVRNATRHGNRHADADHPYGHARFETAATLILGALLAVLGVAIALWVGSAASSFAALLVPFAAGGFLYIAGSDLIPELRRHESVRKSLHQLVTLLAGGGGGGRPPPLEGTQRSPATLAMIVRPNSSRSRTPKIAPNTNVCTAYASSRCRAGSSWSVR